MVEPDCKILTGKSQGKKLLKSQRKSRVEMDTGLGIHGTGRKGESQKLRVVTILSMGHRAPRVRREK